MLMIFNKTNLLYSLLMILSDEPLVLCFDIGTQSIRALVVNPHGEIILNSDIVYKNPTITPIKYGYA